MSAGTGPRYTGAGSGQLRSVVEDSVAAAWTSDSGSDTWFPTSGWAMGSSDSFLATGGQRSGDEIIVQLHCGQRKVLAFTVNHNQGQKEHRDEAGKYCNQVGGCGGRGGFTVCPADLRIWTTRRTSASQRTLGKQFIAGVSTIMFPVTQFVRGDTFPGDHALELSGGTTRGLVRLVVTVGDTIAQFAGGDTLARLTSEGPRSALGTVQLVTAVSALGLTVTSPLGRDTRGSSPSPTFAETRELCLLTRGRQTARGIVSAK